MTRLVIHILAAVGEDERQRISQRTKEALKAAKGKNIKLGNPRWSESIAAARAIRSAKAAKAINMAHPIVEGLRSSGIDSLTSLANALNERGIKTGQGGRWHPQTVKRVLEATATQGS